jgi:hypothetical protein
MGRAVRHPEDRAEKEPVVFTGTARDRLSDLDPGAQFSPANCLSKAA